MVYRTGVDLMIVDCPYCHASANTLNIYGDASTKQVACMVCGAHGPKRNSEIDALKAWNKVNYAGMKQTIKDLSIKADEVLKLRDRADYAEDFMYFVFSGMDEADATELEEHYKSYIDKNNMSMVGDLQRRHG